MAYSGINTTEAEIHLKDRKNVEPTGATEVKNNLLVAQAEGYLSGLLQDDVVAGFAGYDTTTKQLLSEWAARYAGMQLILFNTTGYTDLIEAEDMVQVHIYRIEKIEAALKEGSAQKQLEVNN